MSAGRIEGTVLQAVSRRPGIGEDDLVGRVATATRTPEETVREAVRALEREGLLDARGEGAARTYEVPLASPLALARRAEIDRINAEREAAARRPGAGG